MSKKNVENVKYLVEKIFDTTGENESTDYMGNGLILELNGQDVKFSVEAYADNHISISSFNPITEASWEIILGII